VSILNQSFMSFTYRCISDEQRTLGLGVHSVVMRVIGSIPGPIVVGAIFDSSCLYWQRECGDKGKCYVYDNDDLTVRIFILSFGVRILSILFGFCAWIFFDATFCKKSVPIATQQDKIDPIN